MSGTKAIKAGAARSSKRNDRRNTIPMLEKSFQILEAFREHRDGLAFTDIASLYPGFSRSSVFRMLCTLEGLSYLEKLHNDNRYVLGAKFVELGRIAESRLSLLHVAIPFLEVLQKQFNENVNLAIVQNRELLYLHTLESTQPVRVYERPNRRMAVYCSAIGKAILAYLPNGEIENYLQTTRLVPLTPTTITRVSEFRRELQLIRSRGFAIDNEENAEGVICVGVPILNEQSAPVGGISLSGPSLRMDSKRVPVLGDALKNAAGKIATKYSSSGK